MTLPGLSFTPSLPTPVLAALLAVGVLLLGVTVARRARGSLWRAVPLAALMLALLEPRLTTEERQPLDDVAVVVVDDSDSQAIGDRRAQTAQALATLRERLGRLKHLDLRVEHAANTPGRDEGTRLFAALDRALGDVPRRRLAGVVMITDGQIHDVPARPDLGAPLHVLLTGAPGETDRRLVVERAPSFGLVGGAATLMVRVVDPGQSGAAVVTLRRDGGPPAAVSLRLNQSQRVDVPIEHGGQTVVELEAAAGPHELSLDNNRAVVGISGVRDRLRVLLISGQPYSGERVWRNLLKADPSVDLVHFTILRPPEKDDATPLKDLALISFPVRELFEERLKDFDLIIFDRYRRRGVLPTAYYQNIADYVEQGGGLLVAAGPEVAEFAGLNNTVLGRILPVAPTGHIVDAPLLPQITELGRRHPVTADLPGAGTPPHWGPWLRRIDVKRTSPSAIDVLATEGGDPLLTLDRVGDGRVAELLSDTIWLWARGYDGGGPQAELLRRLAHWLMKEPQLEETALTAEIVAGQLLVHRRSLDPNPAAVTVTGPDGAEGTLALTEQGDGGASGSMAAARSGLYRVSDGARTAVAALGATNPVEMQDLTATDALVKPAAAASGGTVRWLASDGVPDVRRVADGAGTWGRGWVGLVERNEHVVTAVRDTALMPAWVLLGLCLGGMVMAWWREGL